MALKEHIEDIRGGLEANRYPNEAAVSQGIVLRLLGDLGWPTYNTQVVIPEYGVEGKKVDFALCHPLLKPLVFIEAKAVGNIEGGEPQLFDYAYHEGVPIAILTDGQKWRFFHPIGQGNYRERKVHELDMIEGNSDENAKRLDRYLNYESLQTGEAIEAIKKDYETVRQQRQVATRLPEAWSKLVEEADEFLVHTVAEKTESLSGYKPTDEQVLSFLRDLERKTELDRRETSPPSVPSAQPTQPRTRRTQKALQTRLVVTMPDGEVIEQYSGIETFVEVIEKLMRRYGEDVVLRAAGGRPIISTSSFNYPGKRDKRLGRFYISTNHSAKAKKVHLNYIAERLGVQLKVEIVDKQ